MSVTREALAAQPVWMGWRPLLAPLTVEERNAINGRVSWRSQRINAARRKQEDEE